MPNKAPQYNIVTIERVGYNMENKTNGAVRPTRYEQLSLTAFTALVGVRIDTGTDADTLSGRLNVIRR